MSGMDKPSKIEQIMADGIFEGHGGEPEYEIVLEDVRSALAALEAAGFTVVPLNPTIEMVDDACFCTDSEIDIYTTAPFRDDKDNVRCGAAHADYRARYKEAIIKAIDPKRNSS